MLTTPVKVSSIPEIAYIANSNVLGFALLSRLSTAQRLRKGFNISAGGCSFLPHFTNRLEQTLLYALYCVV
jgi:hypothetical protein